MILLLQDALNSVEVLRDDPLLYVLISVLIAAIVGLSGFTWYQIKRNTDLQNVNMELAKAGTEAIASITPIIQHMKDSQRISLDRFEKLVEKSTQEIKDHINTLSKFGNDRS